MGAKNAQLTHVAGLSVAIFAMPLGVAKAQIQPVLDGMFLCASPIIANEFWDSVLGADSSGIKLNRAVIGQIAAKNGCGFVKSSSLRPIKFVAGQLDLTDGVHAGWATPYYYILYINNAHG
jgi:hypothetical protein